MRIAIVDDNPLEIENLLQIITEEFNNRNMKIEKIDNFQSGEEFMQIWQKEMYDVIILDVFMEVLTGVDVAKKIRETDNEVKLVFCTTSNEFASESYSVSASYYLQKPINQKGISDMIEKLNPDKFELGSFVVLPDGQHLILRNMIYEEYFDRVAYIHTKLGEGLKLRVSQAEIKDLLSNYSFLIICGKGLIVNMYEIISQDGDVFVMSNGDRVPISRRKIKEISDIYAEFLFEKMRKEMMK